MLQFTPNSANRIATARADVDSIDPVQKAFMVRFTGTNSRWMGIAREDRADWVTVYINRQSRALDWFPVADPGSHFDGVEVGFRYVKGHKGKGKNPGMARSIADLRTLKPAEDHVLLLRCHNQEGFEDLVKWYAGECVLEVGEPPSSTEVSGEGSYEPLISSAASTSPEVGAPGKVPTDETIDLLDAEVAGPATHASIDDVTGGPGEGVPLSESSADLENTAGGGWMVDPQRRRAIEMHAVGMAIARYVSLGFLVEERGKPFDLLCTPTDACVAGTPTVHVEVKGSLGLAVTVHLTRNEVEDSRGCGPWRSDLYIVSGICLTQSESGAWVAAEGIARWIEGWCPHDDHLTPTDYAYAVPQ